MGKSCVVGKSCHRALRAIAEVLVVLSLMLMGTAARADLRDDAQKINATIPAGDVVLAATLYRPAGAKGDLPAVVLGHGSAPQTREMNRFWANTALKTGLAVLVFDKRGSGESTGDHPELSVRETPAMFQKLAMDMVHAVRWLARQRGIDENRIGLMGGSQAGWIMPLAASQEPLVKFIIVGGGVPLSAGVEEAHSTFLYYINNDEMNATLREMASADIVGIDYVWRPGFDPSPVLESIKIPVLWIYGLYDSAIPTRQSIDRIGQLHKAGKRNHALHIYPFGDHNFDNVFTGEHYDVSEVSRRWLKGIGIQP